ncbi:MAG TPA: DUF3276 family protein [Bacteroidales bacterium]|nr:DUF3276 family protein [Bacteroidales bacterium]HPJ58470.1 DUF3276 family protein [Bacteroidales bacterium]HPR11645.1 DUF3276 family protein [Bacteroidales bacterium]HRW85006.1 DUF3276 family protein [Bacteroidales bacterium]
MEEETRIKDEMNAGEERIQNEEIFTKVVRAGKRTYFFDVKATRKDDRYLTITESKKRIGKEGKYFYEKHKIFLYKEDFEKFVEGLKEAIRFTDDGRNDYPQNSVTESAENNYNADEGSSQEEFTDIKFEDLGSK